MIQMPIDDRMSYMMLFCALLMARTAQATLQQSMELVPVSGNAKELARELGD